MMADFDTTPSTKGRGRSQNWSLHRMLKKTEMCHYYLNGEECKFHGSATGCMYAHGVGELRAPPSLDKVSICWSWRKHGRCPKGDACTFAHGDDDRRQPDISDLDTVSTCDESSPGDRCVLPTRAAPGLEPSVEFQDPSYASGDHPCVALACERSGTHPSQYSWDERELLSKLAVMLERCGDEALMDIHRQFAVKEVKAQW
mmetsp:Transcript_61293/g.132325  ORF Transcript_61293/g.132325 Transcript_61293/m.132325 type:complete len:201 (-) Transcript_61293:403-1005(-)